ncbi:MAG TPA: hypothetical protein VNO33_07555 [Kofleriaceae bacterium]|nr:hypothetical protein [Kofleriaceae bacterium]
MNRCARAAAVAFALCLAWPAPAEAGPEPKKAQKRAGKPRPGKARPGKTRPAKAPATARPAAGQQPAWLQGAAPAGWSEEPSLGRSVGTALRQSGAFGELKARAGAVAHVQRGAGAFYVSWLEADAPATLPAKTVRAGLDSIRESRVVSSPEARSTEELRYEEKLAGGMATAVLEWRHVSNETLSLVRSAAWLSADGKPRLAAAECVVGTSGGKADPAVETACRVALATFAVAVPPAERGALAALPPSQVEAAPRLALGDGEVSAAGGQPPTVGPAPADSEGRVLYRGSPAEEQDGTSKWIILFGVALLLGAFFVTLRARRGRDAEGADSPAPDAAGTEPHVEAADPAETAGSEQADIDEAPPGQAEGERERKS